METSLHRQLKQVYAGEDARFEVRFGRYRIDVVSGDQLVEIQHGSLAAIRDKIRGLLHDHRVLVVKPIVMRKRIIKRGRPGGRVVQQRFSPKQGSPLDVFDELVYFTTVFPHRNLTLETPLVDIEEWRYPGHGRRRWRRPGDHQMEDQRLLEVRDTLRFRTASDLLKLTPASLPSPFHTGHLADQLNIARHVAQRIAYCLRMTGAVADSGKQGNTRLYRVPARGFAGRPTGDQRRKQSA